ncbi:MAG: CerR family C-terminal domain-containing protein [Isosphaeraceae bacterium]|nr:CerR family C-terminal domain-containing protein [Isosphaeraceae bacterium]
MATDPTKKRLLEAAGQEFAEKGFEGATVRSILQRAGIKNIAAINYYFGDKEQLYIQAVIEAHRCGVEWPPEEEVVRGEPAEQLRRYVRHFLSHVLALDEESRWHHALMLRELFQPTIASQTLVREVIRPKFERLLALLRRIHPEADERRLHATAFSIVGQCLHYRMGRSVSRQLIGPEAFARLDLDYLTDHITDFSLAALGLGGPLDFGGAPHSDGASAAEEGKTACTGSR